MRIVWRGGRPFKPHAAEEPKKRPNGAESKVISLDDDEDMPTVAAFVDKPEFEENEEDYDPSRPYPSILQTLDLYFGTEVVNIALLPGSVLRAEGASWRALDGVKQTLVFAAACADNGVRLVTLPLTPPSPESKARKDFRSDFTQAHAGNGAWGEKVVLLAGHQKSPEGVTITVDFTDNKRDAKSAVIIVASHSREVTGSLLLHRVPVSSPQTTFEPFQRVSLAAPAKSISFNPSLSEHRSSHLLVADSTGVCRIYNHRLLIKSPGSEEEQNSLVAEQGTWLLSLYPGFQSSKNETPQHKGSHATFGRKTILDSNWVAGGKAIIVLLGDGEWGVWDIEGVGSGASPGILGGQGITGGSLSGFGLTGFLEGATKLRTAAPPQVTASKFAPMTPGTRKSAEPFSTKASSAPCRGQISVLEVPTSSPTSPSDESIVFWLGDSFATIPNLTKYWNANARKSASGGNLFNGTPGGRMIRLEAVDLQGERCSGIEQILKPRSSGGLPTEILILAEHRFTILSAGRSAPSFAASTRLALVEKTNNSIANGGGELNVEDINQALARMDNKGYSSKR